MVPQNSTKASLELLYSVSRELANSIDLHQVLNQVLFLSIDNVGAERGSLIVLDDRQKPVDAAIVYKKQLIPHTTQQLQATLDQGLAGWVVRHREPTLIPDTSLDDRWLRRPDDRSDQTGAKSAICIPLMSRDRLVGVLTIVNPKPNNLSLEDLALLQAIADQAGIAVYNARLYEALQAAHRRYRELFEDSIVPIIITTRDGHILEANRQAIQISNYTLAELVQHTIFELHKAQMSLLGDQLEKLAQMQTISYESELNTRDQKSIPIGVYVRKVSIEEEEFLQWTLQDISERKELDALRENLIAMIYHDLRSPLSNIISSMDMITAMAPEKVAPTLQPILSIMKRSTDRMQRLISSLLDIHRLEAGQSIIEKVKIDLKELIPESVQAIQPVIEHKNQDLIINLPQDIPDLNGDPDMIRRVIINLLENAAKFTLNEGRIEVGAKQVDQKIQIWVKDNGPGIPKEAQQDIFNKFTRLRKAEIPKGLGLGLAFCKLAVQAHDGKIWVESEVGQGSTFFIQFPTK